MFIVCCLLFVALAAGLSDEGVGVALAMLVAALVPFALVIVFSCSRRVVQAKPLRDQVQLLPDLTEDEQQKIEAVLIRIALSRRKAGQTPLTLPQLNGLIHAAALTAVDDRSPQLVSQAIREANDRRELKPSASASRHRVSLLDLWAMVQVANSCVSSQSKAADRELESLIRAIRPDST